jgi:hypothetical protein
MGTGPWTQKDTASRRWRPKSFWRDSSVVGTAGIASDLTPAVRWPKTPVERLQFSSPRFCPWPACSEHSRRAPGFRFRVHGSFATRRRPAIPRFLCSVCRRTFSRQSFAVSYYLKRPELLVPVASGLQAGSAYRQLARTFEFTQDFPFGVATPVGQDSWFVYGLDPAPHPRTGKRSVHQQARLSRRPRRVLQFKAPTDPRLLT